VAPQGNLAKKWEDEKLVQKANRHLLREWNIRKSWTDGGGWRFFTPLLLEHPTQFVKLMVSVGDLQLQTAVILFTTGSIV